MEFLLLIDLQAGLSYSWLYRHTACMPRKMVAHFMKKPGEICSLMEEIWLTAAQSGWLRCLLLGTLGRLQKKNVIFSDIVTKGGRGSGWNHTFRSCQNSDIIVRREGFETSLSLEDSYRFTNEKLKSVSCILLISVKVLEVLFQKYKSNINGKGLKIKSLIFWV